MSTGNFLPNFRVVILPVTSGNLELLETVFRHLRAQQEYFHELHLWLNTLDPNMIAVCMQLADLFPTWVRTVPPVKPVDSIRSLGQFYSYCVSPRTTYLRISMDIVWICDNLIGGMFSTREMDNSHFMLHANPVNMPPTQTGGLPTLPREQVVTQGLSGNERPWQVASVIHNALIADIESNGSDTLWRSWHTGDVELDGCERYLACCAWTGSDMAAYLAETPRGVEGQFEARSLCCDAYAKTGKGGVLVGGAVCALFAHPGQDRRALVQIGLLAKYADMAPKFPDDSLDVRLKRTSWSHLFDST